MDDTEIAINSFMDGFNCAQAVLSTFGPRLGLDRRLSLQVAGALGAGMSRTGLVCGAVSGGLLVIGLRFGATRPDDPQQREQAYARAQAFIRRFTERNESVCCSELLGCNLSTPEGLQQARAGELFATVCPKLVRDSAEILQELVGD